MRDYEAIEKDHRTHTDSKQRMRKAREEGEKKLEELKKDLESIRDESALVIANIALLHERDAIWEAFIRDEERNGSFPEA